MKHVGSRTFVCTTTKHIDIDPDQIAPGPSKSASRPHRSAYVSLNMERTVWCQVEFSYSYDASRELLQGAMDNKVSERLRVLKSHVSSKLRPDVIFRELCHQ